MNTTTMTCMICSKDISLALITGHITPKCYREYIINNGSLPLCTCNTCKTECSHPGDKLSDFLPQTIVTMLQLQFKIRTLSNLLFRNREHLKDIRKSRRQKQQKHL